MGDSNIYIVVLKVWTSAKVYQRTEVENFYLFPYTDGSSPGQRRSWLAARALQASSWREAYDRSSQDLIELVNSLFVVTQCVFSISAASWFVWRRYEDDRGVLLANLERPMSVVGIGLWGDVQERDVVRLRDANRAALLYFRESGRASTPKTKLAMLVIAAEALAGSTIKAAKCSKCKKKLACPDCSLPSVYKSSNSEEVKAIFGPAIFKALYREPENLRNKLMHGEAVDEQRAADLADPAYRQILAYLQSTFQLQATLAVVNSPRPLDRVDLEAVCFRPPVGWLPLPIDVDKVDWPSKFRELEANAPQDFGDPKEVPADF